MMKQDITTQTPSSTDTGRSMMEMLGTLAIMGVLSIGGIAGYNYMIDKHRANVTINDIDLRGIDLITQVYHGTDLNRVPWDTKSTAGYTFATPQWTDDGSIALKVSGLPESVCKMVVDTLGIRFDIEVGSTSYTGNNSICKSDNTITVFFDSGIEIIDLCANVTCGTCKICHPDTGTCEAVTDGTSCILPGRLPGSCRNGQCEAGRPELPILPPEPIYGNQYL